MTRFHNQMKEARKADDGRTIRDDETWTLEDYRDFMFCVEKGYLVQKECSTLFMINPEWEGDDIYAEAFGDIECEDEDEICPCCGDKWTKATRCDCPNA